ncbi:MAG: universal stress protein [Halobacteriota archaeon]
MYERILIPTDGSAGAYRGALHGLDIAQKYDADVHVLYVLDERVFGQTPALSSHELFLESLESEGDAYLDEIVDEAEELGLQTERSCVRGLPHEEIVSYAEANDVDLIVMGRHGRSAHGRPHIGSCTDRVIRTTDVPVLPV